LIAPGTQSGLVGLVILIPVLINQWRNRNQPSLLH
jgi:hypothetical protein